MFGGIIKALKAEKVEQTVDHTEPPKNINAHLGSLFSSPPFLKPSRAVRDDQEILELNLGSFFSLCELLSSGASFTSVLFVAHSTVFMQMTLSSMNLYTFHLHLKSTRMKRKVTLCSFKLLLDVLYLLQH